MLVASMSGGCAKIPQESVELSVLVGRDLTELHLSYDLLIHEYFNGLRAQRESYLTDKWIPKFVGNWLRIGRLQDMANGKVVWSAEDSDFAAPSPGQEGAQLVYSVQVWAEEAIRQIEKKRGELIGPLDEDEAKLRLKVSQAFANVTNANATITAHLTSIHKVSESQDEFLDAFDLRGTRDSINAALIEVSNNAQKGLEAVKEADGIVDEVAIKIQ